MSGLNRLCLQTLLKTLPSRDTSRAERLYQICLSTPLLVFGQLQNCLTR